ncbi:MAG: hypothetical protein ACK4NF_05605 [Planctomycetota bacterium]
MKYDKDRKSQKNLISQWLNDLKSSNNERIGEALINLSLVNYPKIEEIAKEYLNRGSSFVKFACVYVLATKGNYDSVLSLVDFIIDHNKYIRKVAINGLNSLFAEKIINYDYKEIDKLQDAYKDIKEKIEKMKGVVRWDEGKNIFTF